MVDKTISDLQPQAALNGDELLLISSPNQDQINADQFESVRSTTASISGTNQISSSLTFEVAENESAPAHGANEWRRYPFNRIYNQSGRGNLRLFNNRQFIALTAGFIYAEILLFDARTSTIRLVDPNNNIIAGLSVSQVSEPETETVHIVTGNLMANRRYEIQYQCTNAHANGLWNPKPGLTYMSYLDYFEA